MNNILHIINSFEIGGAEKLLTDVAESFYSSRNGLVFCYLLGNGKLLEGTKIKYPVFDLSKNGKMSLRSIYTLVKIIREQKIDVIHTHDPQSGILARIIGRLLGIRIFVATRHIPDLIGKHRWIYRLENVLLRYDNVVIANSNAVKNRLVEKYRILKNNIIVINNGINIDYFIEEKKNREIKNRNTIGTVARLIPEKGIDTLLEAFSLYKKKYPYAILAIVGNGIEKEKLENLTIRYEIQNHVTFLGSQNALFVKEFLRTLDIFVLPSRVEGFGISLIEAMASGVLVLGSRVDGISEIIEDGYNGFLFEKNNAHSLFDKLVEITNLGNNAEPIINHAIDTVREKYNIKEYCEKLDSLYNSLR
jgi:glycosyltransferase involved in cell wall biosynthesis